MTITEIIKKCTTKECVIRAARTFVQTVFGYLAVHMVGLANNTDITKAAVEGLIISAVAAGLAAVMNLPKKSAGENKAEIIGNTENNREQTDKTDKDGGSDNG